MACPVSNHGKGKGGEQEHMGEGTAKPMSPLCRSWVMRSPDMKVSPRIRY